MWRGFRLEMMLGAFGVKLRCAMDVVRVESMSST